jgi:DNA helicase IV
MFRDSAQSGVYGHCTRYPTGGVYEVDIAENCRNTKAINGYCGNVLRQNITSAEMAPPGVPPEINEALESPSQRALVVKNTVNRLLTEGFSADRIALLSPFSLGNNGCSLNRLQSVNNIPVTGGADQVSRWKSGECLWASTIKSFKGLEADCVIISDLHPVSGTFTESDLYVACSRAKHRLFLIPASAPGADFLRDHLTPTDHLK